ncbi:FimV/HubP family polar landmark protein [Methylobacillus flagellatus]|uniref:FimV/HubP family polar landmark protein n=1 Tax=Methylobacillus flagellatus TaxID=405 RepID=UPI0014853B21|nr:FimV/HubP family polar landmark protein [Methylobacillus flagellatus]
MRVNHNKLRGDSHIPKRMARHFCALCAACLLSFGFSAYAASLGQLQLGSGQGEPLFATLPVATEGDPVDSLSVSVVGREYLAARGYAVPAFYEQLAFNLRELNGQPVLVITTADAVTEPEFDLLVQVHWPSGSQVRAYRIDFAAVRIGSDDAATLNGPVVDRTSTPLQTHTIARGDTLNTVAERMRLAGQTREQMLLSIFKSNPDAFDDNNMHRLKVGKILRAPDANTVEAVPQPEAIAEIRVQTRDWNAYKARVAAAAKPLPEAAAAPEKEASPQASTGKITVAEPPAATQGDRVVLSKGAELQDGQQSLIDKLNAIQETAAARERSIKEANARIAILEKQIEDLQALFAMKSKLLADLQVAEQALAKAQAEADAQREAESPPAAQAGSQQAASGWFAQQFPMVAGFAREHLSGLCNGMTGLFVGLLLLLLLVVAIVRSSRRAAAIATPKPEVRMPLRETRHTPRIIDHVILPVSPAQAVPVGAESAADSAAKTDATPDATPSVPADTNTAAAGEPAISAEPATNGGSEHSDVTQVDEAAYARDVPPVAAPSEPISSSDAPVEPIVPVGTPAEDVASTKVEPAEPVVAAEVSASMPASAKSPSAKSSAADGAADLDFSSINLDFEVEGDATPAPAHVEPAAVEVDQPEMDTKIDLATAYIDMEDLPAARALLNEVVKSGSQRQQARAQALLTRIG